MKKKSEMPRRTNKINTNQKKQNQIMFDNKHNNKKSRTHNRHTHYLLKCCSSPYLGVVNTGSSFFLCGCFIANGTSGLYGSRTVGVGVIVLQFKKFSSACEIECLFFLTVPSKFDSVGIFRGRPRRLAVVVKSDMMFAKFPKPKMQKFQENIKQEKMKKKTFENH